jgi:pantoate--beta-alanine ligase
VVKEMAMLQTFETPQELRAELMQRRRRGEAIALVPTMGYLHEGHAALIRRAAQLAPVVAVSVFVNPLQFGPNEDFERYPRDIEHDRRVIEQSGGTVLFYPSAQLLTPPTLQVTVDPGSLGSVLCGRSRVGHFRGVCTIVAKLFNVVMPDYAVFGWKDAQQLIIIRKMAEDLNFPVEVVGVETVREPDGLAMSSRNTYLSPAERQRAPWLYRALSEARDFALAHEGVQATELKARIVKTIEDQMRGHVDYVEIVRIDDLAPLETVEPGNTMIAAAVFLGRTRLIDNVRF